MTPRVADFVFSGWSEDKLWVHGITADQLYQTLNRRYVIIRNRRNRATEHLYIGRDDSGRCIAAPILPTDDPYVWRPVTAWYCKPAEAAALR